jgi:hypothetical protein
MVMMTKKKVTKKATPKKTVAKATKNKPPVPPTKWHDGIPAIVVEEMKKGYSIEAVCGVLMISKDTLYRWLKDPDKKALSDAKKLGEALSRYQWETWGVEGAKGELPGFNSASWIFNMKNRFGWRDKADIDQKVNFEPVIIEADNKTITMNLESGSHE